MLSNTEENYLKALLHLTDLNSIKEQAGTNELANYLGIKPATATDMLKKLKEKGLVDYEKYGKNNLTAKGKKIALELLRKHRLWETFLYEKLEFSWDEIHEVAEELEHIQSEKLINKLDQFLGYPQYDPHGDPIPDNKGKIPKTKRMLLCDKAIASVCKMVAVKNNSVSFLKYVSQIGLAINSNIEILEIEQFDGSMQLKIGDQTHRVSRKFAENIFVI